MWVVSLLCMVMVDSVRLAFEIRNERVALRERWIMSRDRTQAARVEERNLRRRIEWELADRHWSYQDLVDRLARVGLRTQKSAINKMLKGEPPKRMTANELFALAEVFEMEVTDLAQPLEPFLSAKANKRLNELNRVGADLKRAVAEFERCAGRLERQVEDGDRLSAEVRRARVEHDNSLSELERAFTDAIEAVYGMDDFGPSQDRDVTPVEEG